MINRSNDEDGMIDGNDGCETDDRRLMECI